MSRAVTGFVVGVGLVLPMAWHPLDADIRHDGKKLRPLEQSFTVDGTRVTLEVDRGIAETGDKVTAKLRAFSDTPHRLDVDLLLLHSSNYAGERVEIPFTAIDHEVIDLIAVPTGGPAVQTQLVLGKKPAHLGETDSFEVYIAPHGQKIPVEKDYADEQRADYRTNVEAKTAAAVAITGWSGNSLEQRIVVEGKPTYNEPFIVAVHVANTSGDDIRMPWTELATHVDYRDDGDDAQDFTIEHIDEAADESPDHYTQHMKPGAKHVVRFRVTPNKPGKSVTFIASTISYVDEPGPVAAGGKQIATFDLVEGRDAEAEVSTSSTKSAPAKSATVASAP
jgi:hypothetical protein